MVEQSCTKRRGSNRQGATDSDDRVAADRSLRADDGGVSPTFRLRARRFRRRLARAALRVLAVVALLVLSGITVQARAEQEERALHPPPGELVDIGDGQLIHLRTWGADNDGPAIILDISAATPSSAWAWVAAELAESYRVVAYDRPGMAWSRGPWQPRDSARAAEALARALDVAGIAPPYIVIGHSYGGFSARVFAGTERDRVIGFALLDTTHPDGGGEKGFATYYRLRAWQGHAGLFRLFPPGNSFQGLPAEERSGALAVSHWTSHLDTSAEELEAWHTSAAQVRKASRLITDVPLLVVGCQGPGRHAELQRDLAGLSSRSRFVELPVDHMGMLINRDQARLVVAEIKSWLQSI